MLVNDLFVIYTCFNDLFYNFIPLIIHSISIVNNLKSYSDDLFSIFNDYSEYFIEYDLFLMNL